jgi:hypothetical protein
MDTALFNFNDMQKPKTDRNRGLLSKTVPKPTTWVKVKLSQHPVSSDTMSQRWFHVVKTVRFSQHHDVGPLLK